MKQELPKCASVWLIIACCKVRTLLPNAIRISEFIPTRRASRFWLNDWIQEGLARPGAKSEAGLQPAYCEFATMNQGVARALPWAGMNPGRWPVMRPKAVVGLCT